MSNVIATEPYLLWLAFPYNDYIYIYVSCGLCLLESSSPIYRSKWRISAWILICVCLLIFCMASSSHKNRCIHSCVNEVIAWRKIQTKKMCHVSEREHRRHNKCISDADEKAGNWSNKNSVCWENNRMKLQHAISVHFPSIEKMQAIFVVILHAKKYIYKWIDVCGRPGWFAAHIEKPELRSTLIQYSVRPW